MDKEKLDKIKAFARGRGNKIAALRNWLLIKNKTFTLVDALECIWDAAEGKVTEMVKMIEQLTNKRRVHGRTQVYSDERIPEPDIERDSEGNLVLTGYQSDKPKPAKGQRVARNPKIFNQGTDVQVNKSYQRSEERLFNLGEECRKLYPHADNDFLTAFMRCITKYAEEKKISPNKVIERIKKGRIEYIPSLERLRPVVKESRRVVIINESALNDVTDALQMTEYKFNNNIKRFLSDLLNNPINAEPSKLLQQYGLTRYKLMKQLYSVGLLDKNERIEDKDGEGNFKKAVMVTNYRVPKKGFDNKLQKLYIRLFERNLPPRHVNEDGGGEGATNCNSSGQFSQPLFGTLRQESIYETDTGSVGDYQYDVPCFGDKATLSRKNGYKNSVSINFTK